MEGEVAVPVDKIVFPWDVSAAVVPFLLFFGGGIPLPQVPLLALQSCSLVYIRKTPSPCVAVVVPAVVCDTTMGTHPIYKSTPSS